MAFDFRRRWRIWVLLGILVILIIGLMILGLKVKQIQPVDNETEKGAYIEPSVYGFFNNTSEQVLFLRIYVSSPEYRDSVIDSTSFHWANQSTLSLLGFSTVIRLRDFDNLTQNSYIKRIYLDDLEPKRIDKENILSGELYIDSKVSQKIIEGGYVELLVDSNSSSTMKEVIKSISGSKEIIITSYSGGNNYFRALISKKGIELLSKNRNVLAIRNGRQTTQIDQSVGIIEANLTWDIFNYTGVGKTICVIDSGVNKTHPYITGKIIHEHCFCESGIFGCCPNGTKEQEGEGAAIDPINGNGHGTHVSGIIASQNETYRGLAYNSSLVVVRLTDDQGIVRGNFGDALNWCVSNYKKYNISVVSYSAGSVDLYELENCPATDYDKIQNASNNSIQITAASGNQQNTTAMRWPACAEGVIAVGSSTKEDGFDGETNANSKLKLLAPGYYINSLKWDPESQTPPEGCDYTGFDSYIMSCQGTSMATPHVAAAIALLKGLKEDLTYSQIEDIFNLTGKTIYSSQNNRNFSRIDVLKAIMAVQSSLLQVNSLSLLNYTNGNMRYFAFEIRNANLTNISDITWQAEMGEGSPVESNQSKNLSLAFGKSAIVIIGYNFTEPGYHNVTITARAGNLLDYKNISVYFGEGGLLVKDFKDLYTNAYGKLIQFKIRNTGDGALSDINWSFYAVGDEGNTISASNLLALAAGQESFAYLYYNFSSINDYTINASATASGGNKTSSVTGIVHFAPDLYRLSLINSSQSKRFFEFIIRNPLAINLTNVNWNFDFGDGSNTSNTQVIILKPDKKILVITEYNYTSSGTFTVNATARNGTLIDSQVINVTVAS